MEILLTQELKERFVVVHLLAKIRLSMLHCSIQQWRNVASAAWSSLCQVVRGRVRKQPHPAINNNFEEPDLTTMKENATSVSGLEYLYSYFSEGLTAVRIAGKVGFADRTGKVVIPAHFRSAGQYREGLACISVGRGGNGGRKYGFVDNKGRITIWPRFTEARAFSEGLACVAIGGRSVNVSIGGRVHEMQVDAQYGYIGKDGDFVISPTFDYAGTFAEGLAYVRRGETWGYIDRTGAIIIWDGRFVCADDFREGLAPVLVMNSGYGYIDRNGNFVISPRFTIAEPFCNGVAVVGMGRYPNIKKGYIDKTGRFIDRSTHLKVEHHSG